MKIPKTRKGKEERIAFLRSEGKTAEADKLESFLIAQNQALRIGVKPWNRRKSGRW